MNSLLIDVDEVICFSGFLEACNDFLGTNYKIDDFTDFYIDRLLIPKERMDEFHRFVKTRNFYENQDPLPYAKETIELLTQYYDIYILSSCVNELDPDGSGKFFKYKYEYLRKVLPFINPGKFIFTSSKYMIQGAFQIDDRIENLHSKINILFPSYHNKDAIVDKKNIIKLDTTYNEAWIKIKDILLDEKLLKLKL